MKKVYYLLLILIMLTIGCTKNELTKEKFLSTADFDGYIMQNNMSGYENYNYIKNVYYAVSRNGAYDIQFLELENEDYAKKFFELNKSEVSKNVATLSYVKDKSKTNYEIYHVETSSTYYLVIRNNENILYIEAPIGNILEIEEFLTDLELDY